MYKTTPTNKNEHTYMSYSRQWKERHSLFTILFHSLITRGALDQRSAVEHRVINKILSILHRLYEIEAVHRYYEEKALSSNVEFE